MVSIPNDTSSEQPQGFLLASIPHATLTSHDIHESGTLDIVCVDLSNPSSPLPSSPPRSPAGYGHPSPSHDGSWLSEKTSSTPPGTTTQSADITHSNVWLVLRLNAFEMAVQPTQLVLFNRHASKFVLPKAWDLSDQMDGAEGYSDVTIVFPSPSTEEARSELETLETVLGQYAVLEYTTTDSPDDQIPATPPPYSYTADTTYFSDQDLRGRLVLIDESNGQVVGTLGDEFHVREDSSVGSSIGAQGKEAWGGKEKEKYAQGPVVIDLPDAYDEEAKGKEIWVHSVPIEQQDWMMKGASAISRSIYLATGKLANGMTAASSRYVARTTPNEKPIVLSERTRSNFKRVHTFSGQAVKVTAKTTGVIHNAIVRAAAYVGGDRNNNKAKAQAQGQVLPTPPPPPPLYLGVQVPYRTYSPTRRGPPTPPMRSLPPPIPPRPDGYGNQHIAAPKPTRMNSGPPPPLPPRNGLSEKNRPPLSVPSSPAPPPIPRRHSNAAKPYPTHPESTCVYTGTSSTSPNPPPGPPQPPPKFLTRLLLSTDMLLTTLESSASTLTTTSLSSLSTTIGHKYGSHAGEASHLLGESVRNIGVVYVDVKGVGRRALVKSAGKGYVKARVGRGKEKREVVLDVGEGGIGVPVQEKRIGSPGNGNGVGPGVGNAPTDSNTPARVTVGGMDPAPSPSLGQIPQN